MDEYHIQVNPNLRSCLRLRTLLVTGLSKQITFYTFILQSDSCIFRLIIADK